MGSHLLPVFQEFQAPAQEGPMRPHGHVGAREAGHTFGQHLPPQRSAQPGSARLVLRLTWLAG
jgi:hypothetical protein